MSNNEEKNYTVSIDPATVSSEDAKKAFTEFESILQKRMRPEIKKACDEIAKDVLFKAQTRQRRHDMLIASAIATIYIAAAWAIYALLIGG